MKRRLKRKGSPKYSRAGYPSRLDAFRKQIIEWHREPFCCNGTRIFREVKERDSIRKHQASVLLSQKSRGKYQSYQQKGGNET